MMSSQATRLSRIRMSQIARTSNIHSLFRGGVDTILEAERTIIESNPVAALQVAVGEDNLSKYKAVERIMGQDMILAIRFEHGMNILNLAIDQESMSIIAYLAESLTKT